MGGHVDGCKGGCMEAWIDACMDRREGRQGRGKGQGTY